MLCVDTCVVCGHLCCVWTIVLCVDPCVVSCVFVGVRLSEPHINVLY